VSQSQKHGEFKTFIASANNPKSINYKLEINIKTSHKCLQIYSKTIKTSKL